MKIPTLEGIIDRRILINYSADPDVVQQIIPAPFRAQIHKGKAVVGICLIRLKNIRPKGFPSLLSISSENGAHRIAVEWDENGETKNGVFIPRRDSSSRINRIVGGRLFPGKHYMAKFNVFETGKNYHIDFTSSDNTKICIDAKESEKFDGNSIFETLENASGFFEKGSVGYSPNGIKYDGLKLLTRKWMVRPLEVSRVESSIFDDESLFPKGSVKFDNALLMTRLDHEWQSVEEK